MYLKEHYEVLEYMYSINEVITQSQKKIFFHNWINELFTEEHKVSRLLFEARKVAGSAKSKQSERLFIQ